MTAKTLPVDPFDLVIFGGTGDLALRKLLPGLLRRYADGQIREDSRIIGVARDKQSDADYRAKVGDALQRAAGNDEALKAKLPAFLEKLGYHALDATKDEGWEEFASALKAHGDRIRVFYLSTSPSLFVNLCDRLRAHGLNGGQSRVVIEKPIGHDLASATVINDAVGSAFAESQIFRIDHYLGKETVQNLLALRFANILFEPLWNANHIDHVQITVAETVGLEKRATYYDTSGALRDMVQNHLLQLLCMVAMEPPAALEADAVRDEKLKVLRSLRPITADEISHMTVRGQYRAGAVNGMAVPGYLDELGREDSRTETFVALKAEVDNWRWAGVPFYLRTGKRLPERVSEIVIAFKQIPHSIFEHGAGPVMGNKLVLRLQPDEGVKLWLMIKDPGPGGLRLQHVPLDMSFAEAFGVHQPEAYERLLMDVVRGNPTLFMRRDEVEAAWKWIDPILGAWENQRETPKPYTAGSWGPSAAVALVERDGRTWHEDTV
ncbi:MULTISPECIES: glucose-6-phosphate dehydrogenase [Pseudoxanthomonas]|uniref:glucose-6-phosphate dehydrogenase n=1 Tax=Pseudoxanthomonas TaxID=83618 RepID=UPI00161E4E0B|nr:glucose-6-phosphate dehydrogenase [Pseudoxanthomonas beigongshangi]MBB3276363.1 glucose-6-phosphate 1-dehydrogenase [Pseudoxanthomonas sp. OG2]MBD9377569.1 glucose-6-phosphate dehydrogenase [Pseudoxanthomonas sp. PXM04]MBV7472561.1 glucose-6-phosphate dehydrogenase [Pseudoxanthomonas sp. PXM05]UBB25228.1 glucose-6-phosphate dehydrogenase [Pseudoxanthomonas japonensis]